MVDPDYFTLRSLSRGIKSPHTELCENFFGEDGGKRKKKVFTFNNFQKITY